VGVDAGVAGGPGEAFVFTVFDVFAVAADVTLGEAEVDYVDLGN